MENHRVLTGTRLDEAGVDYDQFGPSFSVPVPVRRIRSAQVLWLNRRWFSWRGIDIGRPNIRTDVESWVVQNFAYQACDEGRAERFDFRADRYGAVGGAVHGGSGRCAYLGRFNVKGIGATPLVPQGLGDHFDGRLLLVDAIREAIYAESCARQSIHGAVETIAIVGTGSLPDGGGEESCLSVRANFFRPAHFERSLTFGTAGFPESSQYQDAIRCDLIRSAVRNGALPRVVDILRANAEQIGALDWFRLVQGRFTSSNVSMTGQVADFGSFRFLKDWRYARLVASDTEVFGKDLDALRASAQGWARIFREEIGDAAAVEHIIKSGHKRGFSYGVRMVITGEVYDLIGDEIVEEFYDAFLKNSTGRVQEEIWPFGCPENVKIQDWFASVLNKLRKRGVRESLVEATASRLKLWCSDRIGLTFADLNAYIAEALERRRNLASSLPIYEVIDECVCRSLCVLPDLNADSIIVGFSISDGRLFIVLRELREDSFRVSLVSDGSSDGRFYSVPVCKTDIGELVSRGGRVRFDHEWHDVPPCSVIREAVDLPCVS